MALASLCVLVPLLAGSLLALTTGLDRRRAADAVALLAAAGVCVLALLLVARSSDGAVVAWMGGWQPRQEVAVGIALAVDPLGAAFAAFAALLTVVALVVALRLEDTSGHFVQALTMLFLAGLEGFCLSGDLFTSFVFFELMSVASYALSALLVDRRSPVEGALNFAVSNTAGSLMLLTGIALLYGRTGALNLAQAGEALHGADAAMTAAFALIAVGFLVKAAIVPFHFWLADAYTAAPTAAVVLFAGAMSEMGIYGIARTYWTVFEGALAGHADVVRGVLVALGAATALVGALMCWQQRLLKRMLAFATISHMGILLVGVALLTAEGIAGAALYLAADGLTKAGLFVAAGALADRYGSGDEGRLHGRGRELPLLGALWTLGGLALAGVPPFGPFLGRAFIEGGAETVGLWWVPYVLLAAGVITGGAVLRAGRGVFLGAGPPRTGRDFERADELDAGEPGRRGLPPWAPVSALIGLGCAWGFVPGLGDAAGAAAHAFTDRAGYAAAVLHGARDAVPGTTLPGPTGTAYAIGIACGVGALALGAAGGRPWSSMRVPAVAHRLRDLQSGRANDYLAWLAVGTAALMLVLVVGTRG
jgi:multicomponent Na+:H+ antiporter subunit D